MRNKLLRPSLCFAALALWAAPVLAAEAGDQPDLVPLPPKWSDVGSAIWVLISFVVLVFILKKAAWQNVLDSLKGREDRIRNDIRAGEEARAKAETLLKEHAAQVAGAQEQVRQMLLKAGVDAEKIASNIRTQAAADAEAERERSRKDIDSAKRDAIRQVYEQTADLATTVASKILGRNLNPQDQRDLVDQTLGQLEKQHT
jgi:F-type H+-transporting ATPase subunit b